MTSLGKYLLFVVLEIEPKKVLFLGPQTNPKDTADHSLITGFKILVWVSAHTCACVTQLMCGEDNLVESGLSTTWVPRALLPVNAFSPDLTGLVLIF